MSEPLSIPEIEELIGAYALDALEPGEREIVDAHLASCPRCRAELADHLEVAALLGNTGTAAPEGVWARIAASLEEPPPPLRLTLTPPGDAAVSDPAIDIHEGSDLHDAPDADEPPDMVVIDLTDRRSRVNRYLVAGLAAAMAVVLLLGVQVVRQDRRMDDMAASISEQPLQGDMVKAMADPRSHKMTLTSPAGLPMSAAAVMTESGTGFFLATEMPRLSADETYQLWGIMGDGQIVSLGVLGDDPHMAAFQASGGLTGLVVTQEVRGGVVSSTKPPLLQA